MSAVGTSFAGGSSSSAATASIGSSTGGSIGAAVVTSTKRGGFPSSRPTKSKNLLMAYHVYRLWRDITLVIIGAKACLSVINQVERDEGEVQDDKMKLIEREDAGGDLDDDKFDRLDIDKIKNASKPSWHQKLRRKISLLVHSKKFLEYRCQEKCFRSADLTTDDLLKYLVLSTCGIDLVLEKMMLGKLRLTLLIHHWLFMLSITSSRYVKKGWIYIYIVCLFEIYPIVWSTWIVLSNTLIKWGKESTSGMGKNPLLRKLALSMEKYGIVGVNILCVLIMCLIRIPIQAFIVLRAFNNARCNKFFCRTIPVIGFFFTDLVWLWKDHLAFLKNSFLGKGLK